MRNSLGLVFAAFATFACGNSSDSPGNALPTQGGQTNVAGGGVGGQVAGSTVTGGGAGTGATIGGGTGVGGTAAGTNAGRTGGNGGEVAGAGGTSAGAGGSSAGAGGMPSKVVCPAGPFPKPVAAAPTTVCQGFQYQHAYNEGPTWVASQAAFFFSNFVQGAANGMVTGDIIKYTPGGSCEFFIKDVGTNGLAVTPTGNLVGATHKTRSITEFDVVTKQPTILSDMYMGKMLDSPNDLIESSSGNIYFSNPTYELGGRPVGVGGAIFRRDPQGTLTLIKQAGSPNGVALSPKEDRLYVVDGGLCRILDPSGTPSNNRDFPLDGADGLAIDCAGNVYISAGSIRDPMSGDEIATFSGGTNLAFGGADGKTLIVVGGGTNVKVLQMNVPGLP